MKSSPTLPDFSKFSTTTTKEAAEGTPLRWLIAATLLTLVLGVVPYAAVLTYPIRLFVTFIHEGGHALAAVLTLGTVTGLTVAWDGSGLTHTQGGLGVLVSSAGYLGTTLFGALLLLLAQRQSRARFLLSACGGLVLFMTMFWVNGSASLLVMALLMLAVFMWLGAFRPGFAKGARVGFMAGSSLILILLVLFWAATGTLFSWLVGLTLAVGLLTLGYVSTPKVAHFLINFLAVQCCLNALVDLKTLFLISAMSTETHTDALNMQMMTGVPAIVWSVVWGVLALAILVLALWTMPRKKTSQPAS
ncbi:MAG: M50 family metallopeptidase [Blastocatellia bacterium]|nr:M50 family metallopeptidase [Blastocatellia bacterium]